MSPADLLGRALAAALLLASAVHAESEPAPSHPNVLLVVFDDLDAAGPGCYGSHIRTPTIDALAAAGMRFTRAYAAAPLCSASRVGLLTGASPSRLGISGLIVDGSPRGIPGPVRTFGDDFMAAGFRTAFIGKWHVGLERPEYTPLAHGFETSVRSEGTAKQLPNGQLNRYVGFELIHDEREREAFDQGQHLTQVFTDQALARIERDDPRPFFVCLSYLTPHADYFPPADYDNTDTGYDLETESGRYAALITNADRQLGRLIGALDASGRAADTLIVVTSDHGGIAQLQQHPERPVRGTKGRLQEGGLRVPFVARWPGTIPAGVTNDSVVGLIDLRATFAELVGQPALEVEGQSLLATLKSGATLERLRPLVWEQRRSKSDGPHVSEVFNSWAVVQGRWKLFLPRLNPSKPVAAPAARLYDLERDPLERQDVAAEHPEVVERLSNEHRVWRSEIANVPYQLSDPLQGEAFDEDGLSFEPESAAVVLITDHRIDVADGELSFFIDVQPSAVNLERKTTIASRSGAWSLTLEEGQLRLTVFHGNDVAQLEGPSLPAGETARVGFTVLDWFTNRQRLTLYVDGELVAEGRGLERMASNIEPIRLGENGFEGRLGLPQIALVAWSSAEIEQMHAQR